MSETKRMPAGGNGGQIGGNPLGCSWLQSQSTTISSRRQARSVDAVNRVDRVDFWEVPEGIIIVKFHRERGKDRTIERRIQGATFDLEGALAWCEDHGFTVRRWPGGARAWRGKPWPIRTQQQIFHKRREMERVVWINLRLSPEEQAKMQPLLQCDFALDM